MQPQAYHNGDGSHKRYETREEFEERRKAKQWASWADAMIEKELKENPPTRCKKDADKNE